MRRVYETLEVVIGELLEDAELAEQMDVAASLR